MTTGLAAGLIVGVALSGCGTQAIDRNASRAAPASVSSKLAATPHDTFALPPPPAVQSLPRACASVLSSADLATILGRSLEGVPQFIKGMAEPAIHRTGRVTCRYGIATRPPAGRSVAPSATTSAGPDQVASTATSPAPGPTADSGVPIELGLSAYSDADRASQRIDFTIHDQEVKGAQATDATIFGISGVMLTTANMSMLALSYGTLTLALSIDPRIVPAGQVGRVAVAIGKAVLRHLSVDTDTSH